MSSPQLENGYTKIANEIMDAIINYRIPGEQMQCLLLIIRKTYGYNKKDDFISNSQFCEATGLKKPNVCRAINGLIDKNIVIKKDNRKIPSYQFNKNYNKWKLLSKKITVIKNDNAVIKNDNDLLSKKIPTKERKENIQKKEKKIYKRKVFKPPSFEDVKEYCQSRNNGINPKAFIASYESKGWMIGKSKMKDWKAAVRTWEIRNGETRKNNRTTGFKDARKSEETDWLS